MGTYVGSARTYGCAMRDVPATIPLMHVHEGQGATRRGITTPENTPALIIREYMVHIYRYE